MPDLNLPDDADKPSQAEGEDPDRPGTGSVQPADGHPSQAEGEDPDAPEASRGADRPAQTHP